MMTENTELTARINSIAAQAVSLVAAYGKPGADSAAAGREVEQMLNEALAPSVTWAAAKPMQPGEHYAGHVCVAAGTSADEYEIIIDAYIQRARENLESIKQDVAAFNKIGDVFVDADQDESADDDEPNPLIKHESQPDPLAVTKRLLR